MTTSSLQFEVAQLRSARMISAIESITVLISCFFSSVFLPKLLFVYMYGEGKSNPTQDFSFLNKLPDYIYLIGMTYFVFMLVLNAYRAFRIGRLESQLKRLEIAGTCCSDCTSCNCSNHENCACSCGDDMMSLEDLDRMVEEDKPEVVVSEAKKAPAAKKSTKKTK